MIDRQLDAVRDALIRVFYCFDLNMLVERENNFSPYTRVVQVNLSILVSIT